MLLLFIIIVAENRLTLCLIRVVIFAIAMRYKFIWMSEVGVFFVVVSILLLLLLLLSLSAPLLLL